MIRKATIADLDAITEIEKQAFAEDQFSRDRWRYLLTSARAVALVEARHARACAAAVVVFRHGSKIARLYSIAVHPAHRGRGIARRLLRASHRLAVKRACSAMRLEVRERNRAARSLYEKEGYRRVGLTPGYYADGAAAVRYEKLL